MRGTFRSICFLAAFALAVTVRAQEGHPLVGSWHGNWGLNATERKDQLGARLQQRPHDRSVDDDHRDRPRPVEQSLRR